MVPWVVVGQSLCWCAQVGMLAFCLVLLNCHPQVLLGVTPQKCPPWLFSAALGPGQRAVRSKRDT